MQEQLEELARGWDVTIQAARGGNYVVTLSHRGSSSSTHVYSDPDLKRAVARAWAGEPAERIE